MEFTGTIKSINNDFITGDLTITFSVNEKSVLTEYEKIKDCKKLKVKVEKYREKRSLDANAFLWKMLGEISAVLRTDNWSVYLQMLKRYGKYTYIAVKPSVVDAVKKQWREVEEIGEVEIGGQKAIQLLCYFGSSTMDTKEFSILLDGVIGEARELGIDTISDTELKLLVENYCKG